MFLIESAKPVLTQIPSCNSTQKARSGSVGRGSMISGSSRPRCAAVLVVMHKKLIKARCDASGQSVPCLTNSAAALVFTVNMPTF